MIGSAEFPAIVHNCIKNPPYCFRVCNCSVYSARMLVYEHKSVILSVKVHFQLPSGYFLLLFCPGVSTLAITTGSFLPVSTTHPYIHVADSFWGLNVRDLLLSILPNPTFQSAISSVKLHALSPFFSLACSFVSFICICIERLQQFSTSVSLNQKPCRDARTPHPNIPPLDSSSPASAISNTNIFLTISRPVLLFFFYHLCWKIP